MRVHLTAKQAEDLDLGLIYGSIVFGALLVLRVAPVLSFLPSCVFYGSTGLPCPTCGTTRSALLLADGNIAGAFGVNPLAGLCLVLGCALFFVSIFARALNLPRPTLSFSDNERKWIGTGAIFLLAANWLYLIVSPGP